jgi:hypothetical protein
MSEYGGAGRGVGLLGVRRFEVPRRVVDELQEFLREAGAAEYEAVGFWAGIVEGDVFRVREAVLPEQQAVRSAEGEVAVVVSGEALFRLNVRLYRSGLELGAQIHSHPSAAYHSETDDAFSVMTRTGGLSLVIPNFGRGPFDLVDAAVHRLGENGRWTRLEPRDAYALIHITPDD